MLNEHVKRAIEIMEQDGKTDALVLVIKDGHITTAALQGDAETIAKSLAILLATKEELGALTLANLAAMAHEYANVITATAGKH